MQGRQSQERLGQVGASSNSHSPRMRTAAAVASEGNGVGNNPQQQRTKESVHQK